MYIRASKSGGYMKFETVKELDEEKFRRLTGVKRTTFNKMVGILEKDITSRATKKGRKKKLSVENMLLMALEYIREYRTYFHISQSYSISESNAYKTVKWVEDTLIKHPDFALPGRKALLKSDMEFEIVLVDACESPIERPKKRIRNKKWIRNRNNRQKQFYSGKKKRHTLKSQVVVDKKSKKVICTCFSNGKKHDFRLFKESKVRWTKERFGITDSGYTGIKKLQSNTKLPKKTSKK
ncbi:hypothetical protein pah_c211o001, partial [Parachlamydia acanthamoebae str. Hall's coccus]